MIRVSFRSDVFFFWACRSLGQTLFLCSRILDISLTMGHQPCLLIHTNVRVARFSALHNIKRYDRLTWDCLHRPSWEWRRRPGWEWRRHPVSGCGWNRAAVNRHVLILVAVLPPDIEWCGRPVLLVRDLWAPPCDLEYQFVGITQSWTLSRDGCGV